LIKPNQDIEAIRLYITDILATNSLSTIGEGILCTFQAILTLGGRTNKTLMFLKTAFSPINKEKDDLAYIKPNEQIELCKVFANILQPISNLSTT
jgi:hypothetical protein